MTGKQIRFFDLFGGIGGFRLGLERASNRYRCVGYSDKDKYAVKSYNQIFEEEHEPTDISEVEPGQLPDFDLLCGGFPCQAFSIAGNREGFEDTRGTLFFEICRIARAKRPEVLLLENVKGLLSHNEGETFRTILASLDELGYDAEWQVLNSKHWGVPQNRERVFIIASLRGQSSGKVFPVSREDGEDSGEDESVDSEIIQNHRNLEIRNHGQESPTLNKKQGGGQLPMVAEGLNTTDDGSSFCLDKNYNKSLSADWMLNHGGRTHIINHQMRPESRPSIQEEGQSGGSGILFNSEYSYALSSSPHFVSEQSDTATVYDDYNSQIRENPQVTGTVTQNFGSDATRNGNKLIEPVHTPSFAEKNMNMKSRVGSSDGNMFTVDSSSQHGLTDGTRIRKLTPRECWRLQGFPDWAFDRAQRENSDTQLYKQAGNAVTVNVIEKLGTELLGFFDSAQEVSDQE